MKQEIISIVIPLYNCENTIIDTLRSVLDQTHDAIEIILINDGSTDTSELVIKEFIKDNPKFRFYTQENQGQTKTRNTGAKYATGKYLLFLDADDKIAPDFIEKCCTVLTTHTDVAIVYSLSEFFGDKTGSWKLPSFYLKSFLLNNCIPITALIRTKDFKEVGGFDENLSFYEDWELWLKLVKKGGKVYQIPEVLFYYFQHSKPTSVTDNAKKNRNILAENKLAIYNKHYAFYSENGYDFENLLKAYPYQEKYYNVWYKKLFYAFKDKRR